MKFRNRPVSSSNRAKNEEMEQDFRYTEIQLIAYLEVPMYMTWQGFGQCLLVR